MKITVKQLKQLIREQVEEMAGNQSEETVESTYGDKYYLRIGKKLTPIKSEAELEDLLDKKADVYIEIAATGEIISMNS